MKRAVLYLRVSTLDQTTANQERELREIAARMGWPGRSIGWAAACKTWSASYPNCTHWESTYSCVSGPRHHDAGWQGALSDDGRICRVRARDDSGRVRAGLARAKSEGKKALAVPGRPGVRKIAEQFGVDPGTVQRISRPFFEACELVE